MDGDSAPVSKLANPEQWYEAIVQASPDAIVVIDHDLEFRVVSPSFRTALGYDDFALADTNALRLIHPDDLQEVLQKLRFVLDAGATGQFIEATFRVLHASGSWNTVDAHVRAIRDSDGMVEAALVMMRNVTARAEGASAQEQRAADEEVSHRLAEARKFESLVMLAGGLAHEFNNMLVGILGNAGLALLDIPDDSPARPSIHEIEEAAKRAATLAQQLLSYSGRARVSVQPADLNAIAHSALADAGAPPAGVTIRLETGEVPLVSGDPRQLCLAISHLIRNAFEAVPETPSASVAEVRVTTSVLSADRALLARTYLAPAIPEGDYGCVSVRDHGSGISREIAAQMFEPFFGTKAGDRGLGLAAVLAIVRAHRGAVLVETAPGTGSTFSLLIPLAEA